MNRVPEQRYNRMIYMGSYSTVAAQRPGKRILLLTPRGFCAGVVRAIDVVKIALSLYGAPIYVRKEIVHNRHVVDELRDMGAIFVEELAQAVPYYPQRHFVKPGITGWAQVRYSYTASQVDAQHKLEYDLFYVKHHSFAFDLMVLLQTVEIVLFRIGSR